MERLAIMGGTFDPIHVGHLRMTHAVQRQLEFDRVVFLPASHYIFTDYLSFCRAKINFRKEPYYSGPNSTIYLMRDGS